MKINCNVISIFIFISTFYNVDNASNHEIKTNGTRIIGGKLYTVYENKPYVAFWKIPYARRPVGKLRFKTHSLPQSESASKHARRYMIATYKPPSTVYFFFQPPIIRPWFDKAIYNYSAPYYETCASDYIEDCLYLTIYMPVKEDFNIPVIVWIHEDSHMHAPDFLIDEGLIVITISFRTSIFGFLNTGDSFAEGNMGAKDILAALRWIRDYISYFNGDLNKVTVFGSGTYSNIVSSLLLSAASEDLFTRVIIQDGSALSPADYRTYNFEISNKLYWNLNGPFEKFNRTHFYQILETSFMRLLLLASRDLFDSTEIRDNQRLINSFGPTIETSGRDAFMSKLPLEVYRRKITNNIVEVMIGYANLNSLYKLEGFVRNKKLLKYLNYNFQHLLPFEGRRDEYGSKLYKTIRKQIMDFYFVNGTVGERSLRRYAKYLSDQVIYPVLRQARLHAQVSCNNVYLYRFTYRGSFSIVWNTFLRNLNWNGATESDEICYQFRCKTLSRAYDTEDLSVKTLIKKIARLWANFVKHGNPTPDADDDVLKGLQWSPLIPHKSMQGLNIGKTVKMMSVPEQKRMKFWDQLRSEFFAVGEVNDDL